MAQSIFANALVATLGRGVTLACGLAATALMVRIVSVDGFGIYSLILTVATMAQLAADFGLYLTLSRELGVTQGKPSEKIANIVSLRLALLLAVFVLGFLGLVFLPLMRMEAAIFLVLAVGLMFQSGSQLLMSVFQAYGCVWRATLGDIIGRVAQVSALTIGFLFFSGRATPLWIAAAFTVGLALSFLTHILFIPEKQLVRLQVSMKVWRQIIQSSWPIALMLILNVIYFRIDTVILSSLRSNQEVGLYSLAYKIIENGLFFPAMVGGLLLPALSSSFSRNQRTQAQSLITQGLTFSFSGACILVALLVVFSSEIIELLAGPPFAPSGALLRVLAIALGSMCIGNIFGFTLIAAGKQKALASLYGLLAVGNIVANLILIPQWGALGAAWITVATEISATVVAGIMVYRHIPWGFPLRNGMLITFGTIAAVAIAELLFSGAQFWLRLCIAVLLYIAMMHLGGVWSKSSLSIIRSRPRYEDV